jgi:hypothetical protein
MTQRMDRARDSKPRGCQRAAARWIPHP